MELHVVAPRTVHIPLEAPEPRISVVIAAYQAADTVGEAVDSALGQSVPPHEVIVVDDGSTDDIEGALAGFGDRVTAVRQDNAGPSAARNSAVAWASGTHVDILDADDRFLPGRHEALLQAIRQRPDLDLLVADVELVVDGRAVSTFYGENRFEAFDQRGAILERCFVVGPVCVRRDRFLAVGGYDEALRVGEDWDLWIRMILSGSRVGLLDEPFAAYRITDTSLSGVRLRQWPARAAVLDKTLRDPRLTPAERAAVTARIEELRRFEVRGLAEHALRTGDPAARRRLWTVARTRGVPVTARVRSLAAAAAPSAARRVLQRRSPEGSRLVKRAIESSGVPRS
jgi:hypothetical protein